MEGLDSLLEIIIQQRPEQIFSDYIIVEVNDSLQNRYTRKNENLGFLIGDNEAIPYAMSCITSPRYQIIRRRLNFQSGVRILITCHLLIFMMRDVIG